jgi:SAM-dependent methyltransferase
MNHGPHMSARVMVFPVLASLLVALAVPAGANEAGRDRYRNPKNVDAYILAQEDPGRAAWQKPDQVLDVLDLRPGQTLCDIGAGPGYFALRAARRVGPTGRVFAVDVDPRILDALRARIEQAHLENVTPVLGLGTDPLLPPLSCDVVLIIDVYHHFPERPAYLRRLVGLLRAGGRLVAIDWQKGKTPIGPPAEHRVSREEFLADAAKAGLHVVNEPTLLLPNQYFVIMTVADPKRR